MSKTLQLTDQRKYLKRTKGSGKLDRTGPKCWAVGPLRIKINGSVFFTKEVYSSWASNANMNNMSTNSMY